MAGLQNISAGPTTPADAGISPHNIGEPTSALSGGGIVVSGDDVSSEKGATLPKSERLCGRNNINALINGGKFGQVQGVLRFTFLTGTGSGLNRIMVSVPKRNFKRAVRRNLLKRRIRESYRLQKHDLNGTGTDILIIYSCREILPYPTIYAAVGKMIAKINARTASDASASLETSEIDGEAADGKN